MSAPATIKCSKCGQLFLKGKAKEHNDSCIGKPLGGGGGGGGAVSSTVVPPKKCRDCGEPLTGPYSDHKPKCSSKNAKATGHEKSPAPSEGGGGNNSKGPKGPQNSSAAPVGGDGYEGPAPIGNGDGKKTKAPKGPESSSAAASSGGGGNKGSAKAAPAPEDLTLIPRAIAQNITGFTFGNVNGFSIKVSTMCAHMVQGPVFSCIVNGCTGKLLKGGSCFTTEGVLFAVVEPKTADNNRAYWRKPTAAEISLLKMPVAATAAADV